MSHNTLLFWILNSVVQYEECLIKIQTLIKMDDIETQAPSSLMRLFPIVLSHHFAIVAKVMSEINITLKASSSHLSMTHVRETY